MVNSSNPTHLQLFALAMLEQANPTNTLTGKLYTLFNRLPLMRNVFTAMMLTKQPIMLQRFASLWTPPDVAVVCTFFANTLGVEPGARPALRAAGARAASRGARGAAHRRRGRQRGRASAGAGPRSRAARAAAA